MAADDPFADIPLAQSVTQAANNAPQQWQETPIAPGSVNLNAPGAPRAVQGGPQDQGVMPYVRIDPQSGQWFIRQPVFSNGRGVSMTVEPAWMDAASSGQAPAQPPQQQGSPPLQAPAAADPFADVPMASAGAQQPGPAPNAPDFHAHSAVDFANDLGRSFARGVPVLGAAANYADAAIDAAAAPYLEPLLDMIPGHDRRFDIRDSKTFGERYARAMAMQRGIDAAFDQDHPAMSTGAKVAGAGASLVGGVLTAPAALAPVSTALRPTAGLIPRVLAGAADGSLIGGAQGYLEGDGGFLDKSRLQGAGLGAAGGAAVGAALPPLAVAGKAAFNATARRLADALAGQRVVQSGSPELAATLAAQLRGDVAPALHYEAPNALPPVPPAQASPVVPVNGPPPVTQIPTPPTRPDMDELEAALIRARQPTVTASPSDISAAYGRIGRAATRSGMTPDELATQAQNLGAFGSLADTSEGMRDLLRESVNMPGEGGQIAAGAIIPRQVGDFNPDAGVYEIRPSSMRILDKAADGLRLGDRDFHQEFDVLSAQQKSAAKPLYDQVREIGPTDSVKLQDLERRPSVQEAKARAYQIAKEEGRDPEALGLTFGEAPGAFESTEPPPFFAPSAPAAKGPARMPSQGQSLLQFIAKRGGISDPGGDLAAMGADRWHIGKAFQPRLIGSQHPDDVALRAWEAGYFPEFSERPAIDDLHQAIADEMRGRLRFARGADQNAVDRYYAGRLADELDYRGGDAADLPTEDQYVGRPEPQDEVAYSAQPTAETWDYIKRGLDDLLEKYRDRATGELVLDNKGRAIQQTLRELRGELVRLNPVYGEALNAWSGPADLKDALRMGRSFMREDAPDLGKRLADMTAGERTMYRLGALQGLKDRLGNANVTYDAANRAGLLKPNQLERFRELFPSGKTFADFVRNLDAEQTMHATKTAAFGNSTTAKQLLHALQPPAAEHSAAMQAVESAGHFNILGVLQALNKFGREPSMREGEAGVIASLLTNTDKDAQAAVAARVGRVQNRQAAARSLARAIAGGADVAGSEAGRRIGQ